MEEQELDYHLRKMSADNSGTPGLDRILSLSGHLRYLVCQGEGNGALLKKYAEIRYSVSPKINLAQMIMEEGSIDSLDFAVSSLPCLSSNNENCIMLTLGELMRCPCVYYRDDITGSLKILTWQDIIKVIAEKYGGIHSDVRRKRPKFILRLQDFHVGGMSIIEYMLSQFASFIEIVVVNEHTIDPDFELSSVSLHREANGLSSTADVRINRYGSGHEIVSYHPTERQAIA